MNTRKSDGMIAPSALGAMRLFVVRVSISFGIIPILSFFFRQGRREGGAPNAGTTTNGHNTGVLLFSAGMNGGPFAA